MFLLFIIMQLMIQILRHLICDLSLPISGLSDRFLGTIYQLRFGDMIFDSFWDSTDSCPGGLCLFLFFYPIFRFFFVQRVSYIMYFS